MNRTVKKYVIALLILLLFAFTLGACGNNADNAGVTATTAAAATTAAPAATEAAEESAEEPAATEAAAATTAAPTTAAAATTAAVNTAPVDKVVSLQIFDSLANQSGVIESWWNDYFKENTGVELDFMPSGDQSDMKIAALLASGELPDLVVIANKQQMIDAVAAGLVVNFDGHKDALPEVYKHIPTGIQYSRDDLSNGTGGLYYLPGFVGPSETGDQCNWGPMLRWDLYKELGSPDINDLEDYLTIVKNMQELYPETEDGQKVYGFSLFGDWDGETMLLACQPACIFGVDTGDQLGSMPFLQVDFKTGAISSILEKDSMYIRALQFYFDANQMGLLDPDSLTQRFDTAMEKADAGRVLFQWWPWMVTTYNNSRASEAAVNGYCAVTPKNYKPFYWDDNPVGMFGYFAIGSATKELDACLRFINFMYTPEALFELQNGPKGLTWDINSEGLPYVTDFGLQCRENDEIVPGGGYIWDGVSVINIKGLSEGFIVPAYNAPISNEMWETWQNREMTNLKKDWQAVTGFKSPTEKNITTGEYTMLPFSIQLAPPQPNDIEQIKTSVGDVVRTASWQMVFASDQAEFDRLYQDMADKANGLGVAQVLEWSKATYTDCANLASKYGG